MASDKASNSLDHKAGQGPPGACGHQVPR
jgi:hypothetical protein